ncbi:MAG TPA: hypothetical protein VKA51_03665, partial [Rubrobacteraceae bacterium]|nr:hypothetical protein [Rubrobacteraceae bacterium]
EEETRVAGVLAGAVRPAEWNVPAKIADFFEAKGVVERLAPGARFEPRTRPFLHPGRAAAVIVGGVEAGWVGELHPETAEKFELEGWPVAAFELDLNLTNPDPETRFRLFVNVPAVVMDLAVIVDGDVAVGAVLDEMAALGSPFLAEARVFDVYEGFQVPEGKKSVALGFTFQAEETLTDEAVKGELDRISDRLRGSFGAEVRGN